MTKTKKQKARVFYLLTYQDEPHLAFKNKKLAVAHLYGWFNHYEIIKVVEVLKRKKG